jgi:hypothetical protein
MKTWILLFTAALINVNATAEPAGDQKVPPITCTAKQPNKYYVGYAVTLEDGRFAFNYEYVCSAEKIETEKVMDVIVQAVKAGEKRRRGHDGFITILSVIPLIK